MHTETIPLSSLLFYVADRDMENIWVNGKLVPFTGDTDPELLSDSEAYEIASERPDLIIQVWSGNR